MGWPRVLHVAQPVDGGVGGYVAGAALAQRRLGWDVAVACPARGELPDALRCHHVPHLVWESRRQPGLSVAQETRELAALVRRQAPDVIHLHSAKAGLVGRLAVRGRLPTLFQPHGWSWLAVPAALAPPCTTWERLGARWSSRTVCVSNGELRAGHDAGISGGLTMVRNGVDVAAFATDGAGTSAARTALGLPIDVPLAVALGRASRQKGLDRLVTAWQAVRAVLTDATLVLAGDGPDLPSLRAQAGAGVVVLGATRQPATVLAAADVVVVPSRWEGLSLALLEGLATGRPVVSTSVSGSEIVADAGGVVLLADPLDDNAVIRALAPALLVALQDPRGARLAGLRSAEYAREHLDLAVTWRELADVTVEVALGQSAAKPPP